MPQQRALWRGGVDKAVSTLESEGRTSGPGSLYPSTTSVVPMCLYTSEWPHLLIYLFIQKSGMVSPCSLRHSNLNTYASTGEQHIRPPFLVNGDQHCGSFVQMQMSSIVWGFLVYSWHPYRVDRHNTVISKRLWPFCCDYYRKGRVS